MDSAEHATDRLMRATGLGSGIGLRGRWESNGPLILMQLDAFA